MQDGLCYIQYNDNTLYAFPDLSCDEGVLLPSFTTTTRQVYYLFNGHYVLSRQSSVSSYDTSYSSYVAHISHNMGSFAIDINSLVLPATLFVLAFFSVIFHWFNRLRG